MQFSVAKTILAIAICMATLASAAPAEGYRCCAYSDCSVCADLGHNVFNCDFCDQEPYKYCCRA
ncbi:hypothetical protein Daus18300_000089 [Diaporthe australafricana]|uniref:Uncharacterized protein n=1 Tax=Diaporthe australafricana TaxID=127596 RepID=A0ABR3Y6Q9_9PEZI